MDGKTPWALGVFCDAPGCGTVFNGDFWVSEDSDRRERLGIVLAWVAGHEGWRVTGQEDPETAEAYCPAHSAR